MGKFNDITCFLFADPSFVSGAATAIDLGGTLVVYNQFRTTQEADFQAMASDWASVGKDIQESVKKFEKEQECEKAEIA